MSTLVRKEFRMMLPAWILAMALAILPVWFLWPGPGEHNIILPQMGIPVFAPFGFGVLLLGLAPFGQELNFGTFSMLLAQPVSRRRLWLVKASLLGTALALAFIALCLSIHFRMESVLEGMKGVSFYWNASNRPGKTSEQILALIAGNRNAALEYSLEFGGVCVLAAFAGGLWTTLLFRQLNAAFWITLLAPMGLGMLADWVFGSFDHGIADAGLIAALGCYSAAGFLWAKKYFLRVEDAPLTGGILSMPAWFAAKSDSPADASARTRKPLRALIRKEFQMQHVNLLIAGLLLLSHLMVIGVRLLGAGYFAMHRSVAMIWESWPVLWLAMPLLIGGVSVAEERKLGTLEGFRCLPCTRRRQFCVKLAMALLLGAVLGGAAPMLVEGLGSLMGLRYGVIGDRTAYQTAASLVAAWLAGAMGLTFLSFYASTLTRNILQALGTGVLFATLAFGLLAAAEAVGYGDYNRVPLWSAPLAGWIGWPVMILTVLLLALDNFRQLNPGAKVWWRNLAAVLAALGCAAGVTTVVYHRAWELWMPKEPASRNNVPFILSLYQDSPTNRLRWPKMEASLSRVVIVLPGGRLWLQQRRVKTVEWVDREGYTNHACQPVGPWRGGFIEGRSWRDAAVSDDACFAIQADGSLWDATGIQMEKNGSWSQPKRFDDGHDWKKLSAGGEHFVALKADGTLWEWGNKRIPDGRSVRTERIAAPGQVGNDRDWTAICSGDMDGLAAKSDGSLWRWGFIGGYYTNQQFFARIAAQPERWLSVPGGRPISLSGGTRSVVAVCEDGSAWIGGWVRDAFPYREWARRAHGEMVQMGNSLEWVEVRFINDFAMAAIRRDGTLWRSQEGIGLRRWQGGSIVPVIASDYADWTAVCSIGNGFLALKNDGGLCLWGDPEDDREDRGNRLLMPSVIKARRIASLLR